MDKVVSINGKMDERKMVQNKNKSAGGEVAVQRTEGGD